MPPAAPTGWCLQLDWKAVAAACHASQPGMQPWQLELTEDVELLHPEDIDCVTRAALADVLMHCCTHTAQDRWSAANLQERLAQTLSQHGTRGTAGHDQHPQ